MKLINDVIGSALLLALMSAYGGTALSDMHPEEAYPDNLPRMVSPGPYAPVIEEVQQKLHERGFDAGMLDDDTLRELGVQRPGTVGSCDALMGTEKERCLQEGGTVEASLK